MKPEQLWQAALGQLELRVSQGNFLTWFRNTKIREIKEHIAVVETPSAFAYDWLSRKYCNVILEVLKNLDHSISNVKFTITSQIKALKQPLKKNNHILMHKARRDAVPATPLVSGIALSASKPAPVNNYPQTLNPKYLFENFVIGPNNEIAHAACKAVANSPGNTAYNPLFIYGGVGLGKTHLMHAVGHAIMKDKDDARILYVSAERFMNDFVRALREHSTQQFKDFYRNVDVLMIDDVQFLAGKVRGQEELFHTFNTLYNDSKQLILSSDRSPKLIPTLEERLRSRLSGGMLVDIQQPDYETRLAILEEKATESQVKVDAEALAFIAKNVQKNVRELEGALKRVLGHCELHKKPATLEYTKQVLEGIIDRPQQRTIDSRKIIETVGLYYNLSFEELQGKCRKQEVVRPRQIAMYLLRKENNSSFPAIGDQFGGRDHTTAMHACEKISKLLEHDEELVQDINFIKERLYA